MEACLCHLRFLSSFGKGEAGSDRRSEVLSSYIQELVDITGGESSLTGVQSIASHSLS